MKRPLLIIGGVALTVVSGCLWLTLNRASARAPTDRVAASRKERAPALPAGEPEPTALPSRTGAPVDTGIAGGEMLRHGFMSAIPPGLELSAEERGRIFAVFLEFIRRRAALEAGMSRVEKMPGGGLLVVIPPYLEIGRQMRRDFYSAVEFAAAEKSAAVRAGMGDFFDLSLRGFGATTQQIEVTADSARLGFYRIQWFAEGTEGLDLSHRKWLPPTPPVFSGTYYLPVSQMGSVGLGYLPAVIARNSP